MTKSLTHEQLYVSTETDDEAMDRIQDTFSMLEEVTHTVAIGAIRGLVIFGPPGVGKTFGVIKTLRAMPPTVKIMSKVVGKPIPTQFSYEHISGYCSPINLYKILYRNRNEGTLTVFDDCDSVLDEEDALTQLMAALDSGDERHLSWYSESSALKKDGIPNTFEFRGSVIFLTNLDFEAARGKMGERMAAMMSRCHYLDLAVSSRRDQILRIKQVIRDGMLSRYDFSDELHNEIVTYVFDNEEYLRELSLRMIIKVADLAKVDPINWKRTAESTCLTRDARFSRLAEEKKLNKTLALPA